MPQTFIYLIALALSGIIQFLFPQLSRLLDVVNAVCLFGIIAFGLGEAYFDFRESRRSQKNTLSQPHAAPSSDSRP